MRPILIRQCRHGAEVVWQTGPHEFEIRGNADLGNPYRVHVSELCRMSNDVPWVRVTPPTRS
jgi:hypothetical protein